MSDHKKKNEIKAITKNTIFQTKKILKRKLLKRKLLKRNRPKHLKILKRNQLIKKLKINII